MAFTPPSPPWGYFLACLIFLHPCNVVGKIRAKPGLFGWGGGGAFLALRLPRKVNPSPGRATASIFSCVFSLFLSFFFFKNQGFQGKHRYHATAQAGGPGKSIPTPQLFPGPGNGRVAVPGKALGSIRHGRGGDGPGRLPGIQCQILVLPNPAAPREPQPPALAEGIPCPDPPWRGDRDGDGGHLGSPGPGVPLLLPRCCFHPKSPSRTGFSHPTSACPHFSQ